MDGKEQIEEMADKPSLEIQRRGEYVRRIFEAVRYKGTEDHEDVWSILWDFQEEIKAGYRKKNEPISCGHENGEWVQLPCKVGDTLYVISQMKDKRILPFINEYEVTSIDIKRKSIVVYHEMDGYIKSFKQTDFGKTIFLTREEAEAKMKGGE
jgi:hypothetical protein